LGNITGAMVFQSTFPVSVGLVFTTWRLDAGGDWHGILAAGLALVSGILLYARLRFFKASVWFRCYSEACSTPRSSW